jgi:DNA-binding protein HU-beta
MNKPEMINSIASKSGLSKKDSEAALDAFVASVEDALKAGDKVSLVGFGAFEVRQRPARKGRNPKTKEEIMISASNAPVFKAGRGLKQMVNPGHAAAPETPVATPVAANPAP